MCTLDYCWCDNSFPPDFPAGHHTDSCAQHLKSVHTPTCSDHQACTPIYQCQYFQMKTCTYTLHFLPYTCTFSKTQTWPTLCASVCYGLHSIHVDVLALRKLVRLSRGEMRGKSFALIMGNHRVNHTFCYIKSLELDWLGIVDHGREIGVDVGGGASVVVRVKQCLFLISRQTPLGGILLQHVFHLKQHAISVVGDVINVS